jgi:hypothetical protein
MIKGSEIRKAGYPIEKLLIDRRSPRAISGKEISHEELMRLFEAARWAPSSFNAEQWRAHSSPDDRIFVWGQSSEIYLDAHRRPASRYITTFPLTGNIFGGPLPNVDTRSRIVPGSWENLEQDFAKHPPAYIIDLYWGPRARYIRCNSFQS